MPIVILCGGRGTRLGTLTAQTPKSLVPVHGVPFLIHQLRMLKRHGFEDVFLMVHHLGHQFVTGWDRSLVRPMRVHCVNVEQRFALGTAGAIRQALPYLPSRFFTLYGDSYCDCNYAALEGRFTSGDKLALRTEWEAIEYGVSVFDNGAFLLFPPTWHDWPPVYNIPDLHEQLHDAGQLDVVPIRERFYEMGSPEGLALLSSHLRPAQTDSA